MIVPVSVAISNRDKNPQDKVRATTYMFPSRTGGYKLLFSFDLLLPQLFLLLFCFSKYLIMQHFILRGNNARWLNRSSVTL